METKNIIAWGIALLLLWAFFWALRRIKNSQPPPDEEETTIPSNMKWRYTKEGREIETTPHVAHTEYPRYKTSFNTWVLWLKSKGVHVSANKQFSNN